MQILFTTGNTWLSRTICAVLDEPVSHVAILCGNVVVHQNLLGLQVEDERDFMKSHNVIIRHVMPDMPQRLIETIARRRWAFYDFGALLFLGAVFSLRRYFRLPMPKQNLWQSTGMFLCTELVTEAIDGAENSLLSPYGLFKLLVRRAQAQKGSASRDERPST